MKHLDRQTLFRAWETLVRRLAAAGRESGFPDRLGRFARRARAALSGRVGLVGLAGLHALAVYTLAGFLLGPALGKSLLEGGLSSALGRPVGVELVRFNPLTFTFRLEGLKIFEPDGTTVFAGLESFEVDLAPVQLARNRLALDRLRVRNPSVRLARDAQGRLNIADLLPEPAPQAGVQPGVDVSQRGGGTAVFTPPAMGFRLRDVLLSGGSVLFEDALTGARHELTDLHFGIKSLASDEPGLRDVFSSGGVLNKSNVQLTVKADPFGRAPEAQVRLSLKDVDLKPYAPYLKNGQDLDFHLDQAGILAAVRFPHLDRGDRSPVVDLDARLDGLNLAVAGRPAFTLEYGAAHAAVLDLSGPSLAVEQVEIASPAIHLERDEDGHTSLDVLAGAFGAGERSGEGSAPPAVTVAKTEVRNGRVVFADKGLGLEAGLEGVRLDLSGFDLGSGRLGELTAKGQGSHFESVTCTVSGGFSPLDLSGEIALEGVDLAKPGPVLRRLFPRLALAGRAQGEARFRLGEKDGAPTGAVSVDLAASELRLAAEGADKPLVALHSLRLTGVEADLSGKALTVAKVEAGDGVVRLLRDREGVFSLQRLFSGAPPGAPPAKLRQDRNEEASGTEAGPAAPAQTGADRPDFPAGAAAERQAQDVSKSGPPTRRTMPAQAGSAGVRHETTFSLREFSGAALAVEYAAEPEARPAQVRFERLAFRGAGFPLAAPLEFDAKGQALETGSFAVSGRVDPAGPGVAARVEAAGLPLAEMFRLVPGLPLTVAKGELALSGEFSGGFSDRAPAGRYAGDLTLAGVALAAPGQDGPVVEVGRLAAVGLECAYPPGLFKARSLGVSAPSLSLTLDRNGRVVLPEGFAPAGDRAKGNRTGTAPGRAGNQGPAKSAPPSAPASDSASGPAAAYDVGELVLRQGRADVLVQGMDQPVRFMLSDLQIQAGPVKTDQPGRVGVSAAVGHSGRFTAEGQAGWVGGAPQLDLKARLDNLDLTELSALSQKYTGFPIVRGKLALNLDYKAGKKLFDLKNRVVVLGIQLGHKTPPPGGKDVPLDLAVSLLTDSKGAITMDIPVSGDTDNLKVDLSGVISSAVAGAFAKVLFSPLAFLNVAKTGGRTVAVAFEPGTAVLTAEGAKTLADLAQALAQRPRLNLELAAYADTAAEAQAFAARLAEERAKEQVAKPAAPEKPGREKSVRGKGAKPAPATPETVSAPAPTQDDWRRLAENRLETARRYLVDVAKLEETRVFTVAADPLKPPRMEGAPGSRADAALKY